MRNKLVFIIVISLIFITGCQNSSNSEIPYGYIDEYKFIESGFGDYTSYEKYLYSGVDKFINNDYYNMVTEEDIDIIRSFFRHFGSDVMSNYKNIEYDFDVNTISDGDYFIIKTKKQDDSWYDLYDNYNVYFFDVESSILYYIHYNI